jgi:hypothetical protein
MDSESDEEKNMIEDGEKVKDPAYNKWISAIYNPDSLSDEDLQAIYDALKYQGFDREAMLKQLYKKFPNPRDAIEVILLCALQGPVRASASVLPSTNKTPSQLGVPASGGKGTKRLTCGRITAATADLAAFHLKRLDVPKKMNLDCPGWLQFPSAGSIDLPSNLRKLHREFSEKFSKRIGGEFNEEIYEAMMQNSYLDKGLNLFN